MAFSGQNNSAQSARHGEPHEEPAAGTALRNGERERILIRCREALAGYRGAALRYRFGAGIMMAVLQKHILSRFQFLNLWVPGAAPDQSCSASGVYTGLIC